MFVAASSAAPGQSEWLPLSWSARTKLFWIAPPFLATAWVHEGLKIVVWAVLVFAVLFVASTSRALVLSEQGFREVPLVPWLPWFTPRATIAWSTIDHFQVVRPWFGLRMWGAPGLIRYSQHGELQRFRGILAVYALLPGTRALEAQELCDLLNDRLLQWRATSAVSYGYIGRVSDYRGN